VQPWSAQQKDLRSWFPSDECQRWSAGPIRLPPTHGVLRWSIAAGVESEIFIGEGGACCFTSLVAHCARATVDDLSVPGDKHKRFEYLLSLLTVSQRSELGLQPRR